MHICPVSKSSRASEFNEDIRNFVIPAQCPIHKGKANLTSNKKWTRHGMEESVVKYCCWPNVAENTGFLESGAATLRDVPEGKLRDEMPKPYVQRCVTDFMFC
jgi:hypothetical protein